MTKRDALNTIEKFFKHPNFLEFQLECCILCVEKKTFKDEYCLTIREIQSEGFKNMMLYPVQTFSQLKETVEKSTILVHHFDTLN